MLFSIRPSKQSAIALVVTIASAFALSGCIKLDMDMKVKGDTKIDGTMIVAFNEELMKSFEGMAGSMDTSKKKSKTPTTKQKSFEEQTKDGVKQAQAGLPKGSTAKLYKKSGWLGQEITFKGQDASKVLELGNDTTSKAGGSTGNATDNKSTLSITKVGGKMILKGKLDMGGDTGTDSSGLDLGSMMKTMKPEMRIRFTFPGKVIKSNGKVSGKSVTWVPVLGKNLTMTAEANAS